MRTVSPRDLLRRRAHLDGARPGVLSTEGAFDYRQVAARAAAAADELRGAGIGPGIRVALALPNSVDYVAWFFGILEADGVVVPISPSSTPAERAALCVEGGIGWIVSSPGTLVRTTGPVARPIASHQGMADDIVALQFSSGSTGRPRMILRAGTNFSADSTNYTATLGIGAGDCFLGVTPFHHAYGGRSILAAFFVGASVAVLPRFLPGPVMEIMRRHRPTVFLATPPMIGALGTCALARGDEEAFQSLRYCVCSSGLLSRAARDAFVERFGIPVRAQYGTTETLAATIDLDDGFEEGRVGRPIDGVTVKIFDDAGEPLPTGVPGRVGIRSDAACSGYANDRIGTAERFCGGWVFPGDRGVMDDRGVLRLLGRSDVINIGGMKVDPTEVAAVIRAALPVAEVHVFAGERSGLPVVLAAVEADRRRVTPAMVIAACRARLSPYKIPVRVEVLEQLPRDENGKFIRSKLNPTFPR